MLPLLLTGMLVGAPPQPAAGLRAPAGFEVTEYAGSDLANDITCMTIDTKGRVVVAGKGYIRTLVDTKNAGRADKAIDFTKDVKDQAMGLLWEADAAFAVVDGGLWRFRIGPDETAAGPPELIRALRTTSDHHAHAVRRGPDGWLYLIAGDSTGIDSSFATLPTSPIRRPLAGCVMRFSPDLKQSEIIADGFRNPYSFDFDLTGAIWTFDADNERCVSLPWQEGTRLYRVVLGGHHGWRAPQRSETWRCPPYFVDVVRPVADLGRGSPTGVVCYKHLAFPSRFRGVFVADWTFGKIWRYDSMLDKAEVFLESTGDNGFAPTALAVHPTTGDLFISIGGRGTRGAVYRVHWKDQDTIELPDLQLRSELVLDPKTRQLTTKIRPPYLLPYNPVIGPEWKPDHANRLLQAVRNAASPHERASVLVELRRHADRFPAEVLARIVASSWDRDDAVTIKASADLLAALPAPAQLALRRDANTPPRWIAYGLGIVPSQPETALEMGLRVIELDTANKALIDPATRLKPLWLLNAARLVQLSLGDLTAPEEKATVWAGYTPARPLPSDRHAQARRVLREAFPTGHHDVDRELTRTLAMLEDDDASLSRRIHARLTRESDPLDDIHDLIVLSRLRGPHPAESAQSVATALLALDEKITKRHWNRDRNWPLRIAELHAGLAKQDANLNAAILNHPEFGRPDHVLFARCPGFDQQAAAKQFLQRSQSDANFGWNAELVVLIGELPAGTHLPILRKLWDRGGLEEAILPILARSAEKQDADRFLAGLVSPRLDIVRRCLEALAKLPDHPDGAAAFALVRGLRLLPDGKEGDALRGLFGATLRRHSGQDLGADKQKWTDWLTRSHPELAKKLGGADGVDVEGWRERLSQIKWSGGDAERGRIVFGKASCAACHSGGQAMGPDLSGVAGRFSRDDLFTAILQPSKDISPRYRTTQIETTDGRTYQGLIVYEAVDGLILQTSASETVRLPGNRIESKRLTTTSMMPTGLLDRLSDAEIADMFAFLKAMGEAAVRKD